MNFHFLKRSTGLCRPPIALFTAYSALTGHLLARNASSSSGILTTFAVFVLAAGASALNQYQERDIDALMERTRLRPLPAGLVTPSEALAIAFIVIATGLALLFLSAGTVPFMLGILALVWYNGVYTRLKRSTAFAAVPGAIVGMIPPVIGWAGAGGSLSDPRLFALCFLFFMWQIPHFWLQVLHHGEDYERAGIPSLNGLLNKQQIAGITFIWICAAGAAGLLLPLYGTIQSSALSFLLLPCAGAIVVRTVRILSAWSSANTLSAFRVINGYIIFVMSILSIEGLFFRIP